MGSMGEIITGTRRVAHSKRGRRGESGMSEREGSIRRLLGASGALP